MNPLIFIKLTESDKRVIIAILLLVILLIALAWLIGSIIIKVMKWQGKRLDTLTYDVVKLHVITDKKHYISYARKKNWRLFFLQSWKPLLIILLAILLLIIRNAITKDWSYNIWDYNVTGFNTLFFIFDFEHIGLYCKTFFGINLLAEWPKLISSPHWSAEAWCSYIFVPLITIGGIWYLVSVQCVIARTIRMYKRADSIYSKSLEGYNQADAISNDLDKTKYL